MALHTFKIVDDEPSHWEGDELVLHRFDSMRLLTQWSKTGHQAKSYEDFICEQMANAPRKPPASELPPLGL